MPSTLEGRIVRFSDKIAYINHDIEDAIRANLLREEELPPFAVSVFGRDTSERINTAVLDIATESADKPYVRMSDEKKQALDELRTFMWVTMRFSGSQNVSLLITHPIEAAGKNSKRSSFARRSVPL